MDQRLKERLIGAAVLVALAVWLIPWVLDGPAPELETGEVEPLELPASREPAPMRTETIDLQERRETRAADGGSPSAGSADDAEPAAEPRAAAGDAEATGQDGASAAGQPPADARAAREGAGSETDDADDADDAETTAAAEPAPEPARDPEPEQARDSAPEPSAAGPEPAAGDWMVQLGSFGEEGNARRLAARVSDVGFEPDVSTYRSGGRLMHRVRVGPHETRDRAEAAASSLSAHGFVAQVVTAD